MTTPTDDLRSALDGLTLPGGRLRIEAYEAVTDEGSVLSDPHPDGFAHPMWFIVAAVRCMGITIEELCILAQQRETDEMECGNRHIVQDLPLLVGATYDASATITNFESQTTRDGSQLDTVSVAVSLRSPAGDLVGSVTSEYLFRRATG
ncbi:hypothetical protein [Rhodococcus sp. T7]|uniref:hypothetical protein n=1 Tax=Rhodococcus sp. T7 TaxID=627444 RepID=UPI00135A9808|nr:hypothetical protein [Rhodococcus sp. T7]KAF0957122.1 hypothetical protein MLGJGCBP_08952 [Rhodococcus sp. T7]KAF0958847.1 hypothetical protein MLGJGCBP_08041 [Rhodococcus sp. T7]